MKIRWPYPLFIAFAVTCVLGFVVVNYADAINRAIHDTRQWYRTSDLTASESYRITKQNFTGQRSTFDNLVRQIAACGRKTPWQNPPPNPVWGDAVKNRPDACRNRARTDVLAAALQKAGIAFADWYAFDGKVVVADFYLAAERKADRIDSTAIVYHPGAWYGDHPASWEDNGACQQERRALDASRHWYWVRRHYDPDVPESKYCFDLAM